MLHYSHNQSFENPILFQARLTELKMMTASLRLDTCSARTQTYIQVVLTFLHSFYHPQHVVVAVSI